MEKFTQEFQRALFIAEDGKGTCNTKAGLAECRDMDGQLAEVASTKLIDMHNALLDEIFQNVFYSSLLRIRRVCKGWNLTITRESMPLLRNVIISTDFFRTTYFRKTGLGSHPFWSLAKNVTTLFVCGKAAEAAKRTVDGWGNAIEILWVSYQRESQSNDGFGRINKVVYANVVVPSSVFRCPAALQVGSQTTLYHCTLELAVGDIFQYDNDEKDFDEEDDHEDEDKVRIYISKYVKLLVQVSGPDSYTLDAADLEEMEEKRISRFGSGGSYNPPAEYFAKQYSTHLKDSQLASLTAHDAFENFGYDGAARVFTAHHPFEHFGSAEATRDMVKQLIDRLDPGNDNALDLFNKGDVTGFAKAAHPLVSTLLYRFVENVTTHHVADDYFDSDDSDDYDFFDSD